MAVGKTWRKLMALCGDAFVNEVESPMDVLSERVAQSRLLVSLTANGRCFCVAGSGHSVKVAIQCKGNDRPFERDRVPALLDKIAKCAQKGPNIDEYWLTTNHQSTRQRLDRNCAPKA